MADIQQIYAILLGRSYQEQLFADLEDRTRAGRETVAVCPFCSKVGKFSYAADKPLWRCWSCDLHGDWIGYLQQRRGQDFREALHALASQAGVTLEGWNEQAYRASIRRADVLEAAQEICIEWLWSESGRPVLDYLLQARGYLEEEIRTMELGAYVDRQQLETRLLAAGYAAQEIRAAGLLTRGLGDTHQLTLLWRDPSGRASGLAARSIIAGEELQRRGVPKYLYSAGLQKSHGLLGLTACRGAEIILLVEGVLDALFLNAKGFRTVAVGGASLSREQIAALEQNGTRELLCCFDADEAGQAATERALRSLSGSRLRAYVVTLPYGYNDPDDLVRHTGTEPLQQALVAAERWPSWLARRICSRHDLQTPRGMDQALAEALAIQARLDDGLERRSFQKSLQQATGLGEEELASRLSQQEQEAGRQSRREALQATLRSVQAKAADGDLIGAETALVDGLQMLQRSRGAILPEPYLLEDFERDILTASEGLRTGYASLDRIFRIPQGAITIIAGRPGHGKTTLQLNLLLQLLALYPDKSFWLFSYEESRRWLALKCIMLLSGMVLQPETNQGAYINYLREKRGEQAVIEQAIQQYEQLTASGRLVLSDQRLAGEDLAGTIGHLSARGDVGAVLVDYIQKIPLRREIRERYLAIKTVSELLLEQAVRTDLPIILGAQLGRDKGASDKVRLDNLRESGDIEQDANAVLGLYDPAREKADAAGTPDRSRTVDLKITILKSRGSVAYESVTLEWERPALRITEKRGGWT